MSDSKKKPGSGAGKGSAKSPKPKGPSPTAQRQQKRREERLALIDEQVKDGSLTIRQMTPEERRQNPPQDRSRKKRK